MKKLKYSWIVFLPLMALVLSGCGRKQGGSEQQTQTIVTQPSQNAFPPTPTTPPTPPAGPSGPTGGTATCTKQVINKAYYERLVQGTGNVSVDTLVNEITGVDQVLKVQIEPVSTGGSQGSTMMAVDVSIIRNGQVVSTDTFPGTTGPINSNNGPSGYDTNQYRMGIAVGAKHNKDFSSSISGNSTYGIRISRPMSDAVCNQFCSANNTAYTGCWYVSPAQCQQWTNDGHYGNYVYTYCSNIGTYGCAGPDWGMITTCRKSNCNVNTVSQNANWSVRVRVETDTSSCLPQ